VDEGEDVGATLALWVIGSWIAAFALWFLLVLLKGLLGDRTAIYLGLIASALICLATLLRLLAAAAGASGVSTVLVNAVALGSCGLLALTMLMCYSP
jgi:hypothetical protein